MKKGITKNCHKGQNRTVASNKNMLSYFQLYYQMESVALTNCAKGPLFQRTERHNGFEPSPQPWKGYMLNH